MQKTAVALGQTAVLYIAYALALLVIHDAWLIIHFGELMVMHGRAN